MACNLIPNVGYNTGACSENFSGVGGEVFIFLKEDLEAAPAYDETGKTNSFKETTAFKFKQGKGAYRVKLKKQVNSVTWSNNPNSGGYTVTATFTVADDMDNMAINGRALNNLGGDWGVMIPKSTADGTDEYYVIYNHQFGLSTFTVEGTTGDAPDSDHGHTYTVAATMLYGPTTWKGTIDTDFTDTSDSGEETTGL